jgi:hypothetical protein
VLAFLALAAVAKFSSDGSGSYKTFATLSVAKPAQQAPATASFGKSAFVLDVLRDLLGEGVD